MEKKCLELHVLHPTVPQEQFMVLRILRQTSLNKQHKRNSQWITLGQLGRDLVLCFYIKSYRKSLTKSYWLIALRV